MRVDNVGTFQLPLPVETDNFAAGAKSGVNGEDVFAPERRRHEQFAEILGEERRMLVRLPSDYGSSEIAYPVLVMLDAERFRPRNVRAAQEMLWKHFNSLLAASKTWNCLYP